MAFSITLFPFIVDNAFGKPPILVENPEATKIRIRFIVYGLDMF